MRECRRTRGRLFRLRLSGLFLVAAALPACESTVVSTVEVAEVEVDPPRITLIAGGQVTASATPRESGGGKLPDRPIEWSVDDPDVATVNPDGVVEGRSPGATRIHASSEGVSGSADVTVIAGPAIGVSAETVHLDGTSGDPTLVESEIEVENAGNGTLDELTVRVIESGGSSADWLEVQLMQATAPTRVRLHATAEDLEPGSHHTVLALESPAAGNSPVEVTVRMNAVEAPAQIGVSPSSISLEAVAGSDERPSTTLEISNTGGGTLSGLTLTISYDSGHPEGWLDAELAGTQAPTTALVEASAGDLDPGVYRAEIRIGAPGASDGPKTVRVEFRVERPSEEPVCNVENRTLGDVVIPPNTSCIFTNVRIRGDLTLQSGASLVGAGLTVEDDIEARSADALVLLDSRVDGNVEFERGGSVQILDTFIDGNVDLESNNGSLDARDNTIEGNLQVFDNTGGPFTFFRNTIDGNLQCKGNAPPPSGGGNRVDGNKEDQCRDL